MLYTSTEGVRIICFGSSFPNYIIRLANALSKRDKVMLLMPSRSLSAEELATIDKEVGLRVLGGGKPWYPWYFLNLLMHSKKAIGEFRPDIIHLQVGAGLQDCFVLPWVKKYPLVATFHDVRPHLGDKYRWRARFLHYWVRRYADQIIVHGEQLKRQMVDWFEVPGSRVHVVPMGEGEFAPFAEFAREGIEEEENTVLFFGRVYPYKGLEYLIRAEPMITQEVPGARIVIAGEREDFRKYERMMVHRQNFVVHNRRLSYEEGARLFQTCSLVVLPYVEASQSAVVPVAYGFRRPVVVSRVGSLAEIVEEGETGLLVPPGDSEALAQAILKLLKDKDLRKRMGEKGFGKLRRDLSQARIVDRTLGVYREACKGKK